MPALSKTRLTDEYVRRAGAGDHADSEVRGLYLRVTAAGSKAWTLRYRAEDGQRRITLGHFPAMLTAEARRVAKAKIGEVMTGADPSAEKKEEKAKDPTFAEMARRYQDAGLFKPKTKRNQALLFKMILPVFGHQRLSEIEREDIEKWHRSMSATPAQANACVSLMSTVYRKAAEWEKTARNPAFKIKLFKQKKHERFLDAEERALFWRTLDEAETDGKRRSKAAINALRFIALTGFRKMEALTMTWDMVEWEHEVVILPETKIGRSTRDLSDEALSLLRKLYQGRDPANPWVFPGRAGTPPTKSFDVSWGRIRKLMPALEGFRVHDLRHSLASDALNAGVPLAVVGGMLGHKDEASTKRYAHLCRDVVKAATKKIGKRLAERHQPDPGDVAEVIPIRKKQA